MTKRTQARSNPLPEIRQAFSGKSQVLPESSPISEHKESLLSTLPHSFSPHIKLIFPTFPYKKQIPTASKNPATGTPPGLSSCSHHAGATLPSGAAVLSSHTFCRTFLPSYQTELSQAVLVSQYYSNMEINNIKFTHYITFPTLKKGNTKDRPAQQNNQSGTLQEH